MARKRRSQINQAIEKSHWQQWRLLIRNPKFWYDLTVLNERYWIFLKAYQKKSEVAPRKLYEYESLSKIYENKWQIKPIPIWSTVLTMTDQPYISLIRDFEYMYGLDDPLYTKEKPVSYSPVQVINYDHVENFLDLRLDLTKPLYLLEERIEKEVKKLDRSAKKLARSAMRNRPDKSDDYLAVWDLRQQGLTADEIAPKLWPKEWTKKGGRASHYGDKGPLIQRVYDHEKAAQKLIDNTNRPTR